MTTAEPPVPGYPIAEHPELAAEQAYVTHAYNRLREMRARVAGFTNLAHQQLERLAFEEWRTKRIRALADDSSALVFGRIDGTERWYIGRRHVDGTHGEVVVVDWRAPVASAFYRASHADPMGLALRRHFLVDGAHVLGLADQHLDDGTAAEAERAGIEVLRATLEMRRGGEMRDIVATIQAEQDLIIRAPLEGIVIVQGGPGTGKTAVGLHRAAFLLYEHRKDLSKRGALVVGPNRIFIRYVEQVLPSLGEGSVDQRALEALGPAIPLHPARDMQAEAIKADARMAEVISRALWGRVKAATEPMRAAFRGTPLVVNAERLNVLQEAAREDGSPYNIARERFVASVYRELFRQFEAGTPSILSVNEFSRGIRADGRVARPLEAMWPRASASSLVGALVAGNATLRVAASGLLSDDEIATLRRGARAQKKDRTRADLALLDEAGAAIGGHTETFGHLILDEAQDLSPMELRMVARRCPSGSMTILGDLAQGTTPWAARTWEDVLLHLGASGGTVSELTIGYRVAEEIMTLAAAILADVRPDLRAPSAVRRGGSIRVASTDTLRLATDAARIARALPEAAAGAYAIIAPDHLQEPLRAALTAEGVDFGEAARDALHAPITLLAARDCKGLEFDGVVLIEPAAIVEEEGMARLYICVTRAMRELVVVHAQPLPDAMTESYSGRAAG